MKNQQLHFRAFITLVIAFCFLVLVFTGIVLYIEPHGRVAYWTEWRFLGLGKQHWDGVHMVAALLFLMASVFHLYLNWKPLKRFLQCRLRQGVGRVREMALALLLVVLCSVGAASGWQPFRAFLDLNERVKSSWAASPASQPPFGHAELVSLKSLCLKTGIQLPTALANLKNRFISFADEHQLLRDVAKANNMTPHAVFRVMIGGMASAGGKVGHDASRHKAAGSPAAARVFRTYTGRGLGKKTLRDLCRELGLGLKQGRQALDQKGIQAEDDQTIKEIALGAGWRPRALLDVLGEEVERIVKQPLGEKK